MIYFAHRGANHVAPANSTAAFALARQHGATSYELDIHLTKDGQLLVHHDYTLSTDTTCPLEIKHVTWPEVQRCQYTGSLDMGTSLHPPLLSEVLPLLVDGAHLINIELKNDDNIYPGIEQALWNCVQQQVPQATSKLLFSSFDVPTLQRLRQLAPKVKIGWLTRAFDPQVARELKVYSVHMRDTRITPQIVQVCHSENWNVFVYTVNNKQTEQHLARMGVDGIFTDDVRLFLK